MMRDVYQFRDHSVSLDREGDDVVAHLVLSDGEIVPKGVRISPLGRHSYLLNNELVNHQQTRGSLNEAIDHAVRFLHRLAYSRGLRGGGLSAHAADLIRRTVSE